MAMRNQPILITLLVFLIMNMSPDDELRSQIVSPEVHPDRKVTFRLLAPNAEKVLVKGLVGQDAQPMQKGDRGIWEVTVGPLVPELHSYVFEVDGADLLDPSNRMVKKWLTCQNMVEVPGTPPLLHEQQSVPHGVVHHHLYPSKSADRQRGVYVYTPPGYDREHPDGYPLLVLLHGFGDDESAWLEVGRAHYIADNLLAAGTIQPLVIAMPYGHPLPIERPRTFRNDYASRNIDAMDQDLQRDLMPLLERTYPITDSRMKRAIAGLSMGGGQSLTIGLRHLDQFAWIAGFSSATPSGDLDQQFSHLVEDVARTNERLGLLWIGCGKDDFLIDRNRDFTTWLSDKGIDHTYRLTDGGHDWTVWRKYLAELLPLLFLESGDSE